LGRSTNSVEDLPNVHKRHNIPQEQYASELQGCDEAKRKSHAKMKRGSDTVNVLGKGSRVNLAEKSVPIPYGRHEYENPYFLCPRKFNNLYLLICTLSVQFVLLTRFVNS